MSAEQAVTAQRLDQQIEKLAMGLWEGDFHPAMEDDREWWMLREGDPMRNLYLQRARAMFHRPLNRAEGLAECGCGWRDEGTYAESFGARVAYLDHLVRTAAAAADWPEDYYVEGDDSYVGDAS